MRPASGRRSLGTLSGWPPIYDAFRHYQVVGTGSDDTSGQRNPIHQPSVAIALEPDGGEPRQLQTSVAATNTTNSPREKCS